MGLLGIMAVGITTMLSNANKQQRGLMAKDQLRDVGSEIAARLSNPLACKQTFSPAGTQSTADFTVDDIRDSSGTSIFHVGDPDKSNLLTFTQFAFQGFVPDPSNPMYGMATLWIRMTKIGETLTTPEVVKKLTLRVRLNVAGGPINDCFYVAASVESLWQISPSTVGGIYYMGGSVGIGKDNPGSTLAFDVLGDSLFTGNTTFAGNIVQSGAFSIQNSANPLLLDTGGANAVVLRPSGVAALTASPGGNVAVAGALTVAGAGSYAGALSANAGLSVAGGNINAGGVDMTIKDINAQHVTTPSDESLKQNLQDITNPLKRVQSLKGTFFDWKADGEKDIGFIAQKVREVVPELVVERPDGLLAVKYQNISALLVEAIKELEAKRKADELRFEEKIKDLEKEITSLKKEKSK